MSLCARTACTGIGLAGLATGLMGCMPTTPDDGSSFEELVLSAETIRPPASSRYSEVESNDTFDTANLITLNGSVEFSGSIAAGTSTPDQDLFELGPAEAGDRITADLDASLSGDLQLALLDDEHHLLAMINHSYYSASPPSIDIVLRESTSQLFAAVVTRSALENPRGYDAYVSIQTGGVLGYHPQVLILEFDGADNVQIGNRPATDVPAFDGAAIGPAFAGRTEWLINRIVEMVAEDYAGLNVAVHSSNDPDIPPGEQTTIYFGTYDPGLLGLADNIDPYNRDTSQEAVVYTDTFSLFNVLSPTEEEMAQVLANVASHEAGHLLGLRHTADARSLMDISASARQMMLDQWFKQAPMHPSVLAVGVQDAPVLLSWTVGGTPPVAPAGKQAILKRAADVANDPNDFYIPREMLGSCFCKKCEGNHQH